MATYRHHLPQLDAVFLTDGGLETSLIYDQGIALPYFAAITLMDDEAGRAALRRYFDAYAEIARRDGVGIVLETPTWRASSDWAAPLGYTPEHLVELNAASVVLLEELRSRYETPATPVVISGCLGPRGDGYRPEEQMSVEEATAYHGEQVTTFATTNADLVTAITMTYPEEAIGITTAAKEAGMPVVVSFTVETDGRLPTGARLSEAIEAVDAATGTYPAYYMVNCAHPTHFDSALVAGADWTRRLGGVRANASRLSHAELDEATELDSGDPRELAEQYLDLRRQHPQIRVMGGCCGTNHEHVDAISAACAAPARA